MKGTYHDGQMCFSVLSYRELTQSFLDLQEVGGVDGRGMALDLLSRVFQLCMLSDFSSSMLVEFPRIRLCQKVLIKLMWCMDQD